MGLPETSEGGAAKATTAPDVQRRGEHLSYNDNTPKSQPIQGAPTHLVGSPKVVVSNRGTSTSVTVEGAPWGWGNLSQTFLHSPLATSSKGAARYELALRQRIADAAWAEHGRRERNKALKAKEHAALNGGRR